jgi:signal recognition particle subunit SRP54
LSSRAQLKILEIALVEADVNVGVVRSVLARIRDKTVGAEASKALDPAQQVVKIVHAELIGLLGGETLKITYASQPPGQVEFMPESWSGPTFRGRGGRRLVSAKHGCSLSGIPAHLVR